MRVGTWSDCEIELQAYLTGLAPCRECRELAGPDHLVDGLCDQCFRRNYLAANPAAEHLIEGCLAEIDRAPPGPLAVVEPAFRHILCAVCGPHLDLAFREQVLEVTTSEIFWHGPHTPVLTVTGRLSFPYTQPPGDLAARVLA